MDDMELIRGLGRDLEHEPPASLVRQRERLLRAGGRRGRPGRWALLGVVAAVTAAAVLVPVLFLRGEQAPAVERPGVRAFNVLLVGSDGRGPGGAPRSDTLMLLHVPEGRGAARVVSFPRDLLVDLPQCGGGARGLINAAFTAGGAACSRRTVEELTGVRIDRTATVGFDGFRTIVDALGGVEVLIPRAIEDPKAGLSLPAGRHRLGGRDALAFVRTRYGFGDGSDLSRIERQHAFLKSMAGRIAELRKDPVRLARFLAAVAGAVETEPRLDAGGLVEFAESMAKIGADDVAFGTVPVVGAPDDPNRLVADGERAERLFAQLRTDE